MLIEYTLDHNAAVAYARRWALGRNPAYYDFSRIGGDCTNFISQCIFASGAVMNYTADLGWYYISQYDRAAPWTSVEHFAKFMLDDRGVGPFGRLIGREELAAGDVVQLGDRDGFYHNLLVVGRSGGEVYVAAHTNDVFGASLRDYSFSRLRCMRIDRARRYA